MRGNDPQNKLAFALDPGEIAERRNKLGLAVLRLQGFHLRESALQARELLIWIFNTTVYGTNGDLRKSYAELSSAPWGLCCSESRVRSVVRILRKHRILKVEESRYKSEGQTANSYSIDWNGIHQLLGIKSRTGVLTEHPPVLTEHPPVLTEHPPVLTEHPYRNTPLLYPLLLNTKPEPVPERPAPPTDWVVGLGEEPEADGYTSLPRTRADQLRDQVLGTVPELVASAGTELESLAPERLVYGAFAAIEARHVRQPVLLARWFRMQLGLAQPVLPGTEADALLVVAAGLYALRLPETEVRKNRVAVFVNLILHRNWWDACPYVPEARRLIDEVISREGTEWIGRKIPVGACS